MQKRAFGRSQYHNQVITCVITIDTADVMFLQLVKCPVLARRFKTYRSIGKSDLFRFLILFFLTKLRLILLVLMGAFLWSDLNQDQ